MTTTSVQSVMSKYDKWKTTNPDDVGHRDDCCVSINSHWESPRCNCEELEEKDER
jgi:hypothetical protein